MSPAADTPPAPPWSPECRFESTTTSTIITSSAAPSATAFRLVARRRSTRPLAAPVTRPCTTPPIDPIARKLASLAFRERYGRDMLQPRRGGTRPPRQLYQGLPEVSGGPRAEAVPARRSRGW